MKKIFAIDLNNFINQEIDSFFAVKTKSLRKGAMGEYLKIILIDKTDEVEANVWENAVKISKIFEEGDIIKVRGRVYLYNDRLQIKIDKIRQSREGEYNIKDFLPVSSKDSTKLLDRLFYFIDTVKNKYLNELLHLIFDDKEFLKKFQEAPAAKSWHHSYMGGLLEHTLAVVEICNFAVSLYDVDSDLLITSAIIHDIGKIREYQFRPFIDFTDEGRLVGHISLGDQMIVNKIDQINNFPPELKMKLRHLILSHHGEYEKTAARLPQIPEAFILYFVDNLDAQTIGVMQKIEKAKNEGRVWTEYDLLHKRYYYTD